MTRSAARSIPGLVGLMLVLGGGPYLPRQLSEAEARSIRGGWGYCETLLPLYSCNECRLYTTGIWAKCSGAGSDVTCFTITSGQCEFCNEGGQQTCAGPYNAWQNSACSGVAYDSRANCPSPIHYNPAPQWNSQYGTCPLDCPHA